MYCHVIVNWQNEKEGWKGTKEDRGEEEEVQTGKRNTETETSEELESLEIHRLDAAHTSLNERNDETSKFFKTTAWGPILKKI